MDQGGRCRPEVPVGDGSEAKLRRAAQDSEADEPGSAMQISCLIRGARPISRSALRPARRPGCQPDLMNTAEQHLKRPGVALADALNRGQRTVGQCDWGAPQPLGSRRSTRASRVYRAHRRRNFERRADGKTFWKNKNRAPPAPPMSPSHCTVGTSARRRGHLRAGCPVSCAAPPFTLLGPDRTG